MKKYYFLLKPASFILSLLFSSWMVLQIELKYPSANYGVKAAAKGQINNRLPVPVLDSVARNRKVNKIKDH